MERGPDAMDPRSSTGEQYSSDLLISGENMEEKLIASVVPCRCPRGNFHYKGLKSKYCKNRKVWTCSE